MVFVSSSSLRCPRPCSRPRPPFFSHKFFLFLFPFFYEGATGYTDFTNDDTFTKRQFARRGCFFLVLLQSGLTFFQALIFFSCFCFLLHTHTHKASCTKVKRYTLIIHPPPPPLIPPFFSFFSVFTMKLARLQDIRICMWMGRWLVMK